MTSVTSKTRYFWRDGFLVQRSFVARFYAFDGSEAFEARSRSLEALASLADQEPEGVYLAAIEELGRS